MFTSYRGGGSQVPGMRRDRHGINLRSLVRV